MSSPKHQEDKVMPPLVDLSNFLAIFLPRCQWWHLLSPFSCWFGTPSYIFFSQAPARLPPATCLSNSKMFEQIYQIMLYTYMYVHTSPTVALHHGLQPFSWAPIRCFLRPPKPDLKPVKLRYLNLSNSTKPSASSWKPWLSIQTYLTRHMRMSFLAACSCLLFWSFLLVCITVFYFGGGINLEGTTPYRSIPNFLKTLDWWVYSGLWMTLVDALKK